ncbi:LPXTG cell wall anchor domain-containing protein [Neobacillus niacini]|uniref:LPXTG cell wall anchor domain-containing protein n=1 Tax=Neobacillus niacini TaxID=86668 RepID=UPI0021CB99A0|nr:LPXTG cell wall anchor domain-containing protein [Neobacillus niacini]MCM3765074.1 LPXTG cell wall anchor domain-containing protein [Neobacillus niacini]
MVVIEITNITKDSQNPGGGNGVTPNPTPGSDGNDKPNPTPASIDQNKDKPAPAPTSKTNGKGHSLPNTVTALYNYLALGGILVLAGGAMMIKRRREN